MSITENCMIVNLSISQWHGHRLDKEASRDLTARAGADSDSARVNKHLIDKKALKPIIEAANKVRTHYYTATLPWRDNGDRLLTRKMFTDFMSEHHALVGEFNRKVEDFITDDYPRERERAAFRMGDLFNPDDYPSADMIRRKFAINLDMDIVSDAKDFRVQLDKDETDRIRSNIAETMNRRANDAMQHVWQRLAETLGKFAERMSDEKAVFQYTTVSNLDDLVAALPKLNLMDDPDLDALTKALEERVIGHTADELRSDAKTRARVADEASKIMDEMAGFMSAFGTAA